MPVSLIGTESATHLVCRLCFLFLQDYWKRGLIFCPLCLLENGYIEKNRFRAASVLSLILILFFFFFVRTSVMFQLEFGRE